MLYVCPHSMPAGSVGMCSGLDCSLLAKFAPSQFAPPSPVVQVGRSIICRYLHSSSKMSCSSIGCPAPSRSKLHNVRANKDGADKDRAGNGTEDVARVN